MPSAETRIRTARANAYLARLCGHLSKLASSNQLPRHGPRPHTSGQPPEVLHAEHTDGTGTITLTWGQLTLYATADQLTIRADADSPENLLRLQDMTTGRLLKFGRRDHLDIRWTPTTGTASEPQQAAKTDTEQPKSQTKRHRQRFGL